MTFGRQDFRHSWTYSALASTDRQLSCKALSCSFSDVHGMSLEVLEAVLVQSFTYSDLVT